MRRKKAERAPPLPTTRDDRTGAEHRARLKARPYECQTKPRRQRPPDSVEMDGPAVYDSVMPTRITAPFATPEDTAAVLGVSKSRFKLLERLAHASRIFKAKDVAANGASSSRSAKPASKRSASLRSRAKVGTAGRKSKARSGKGRSGAKG
jgi:hypothetical protein